MTDYRAPLLLVAVVLAFALRSVAAAEGLEPRSWSIDGVDREALFRLHSRAAESAAPVVFVFHGHGETMQHASRTFAIHRLWPEAIVVYPQGLSTPGQLPDPEGRRAGWQPGRGALGGRDLVFFDAMLATLRRIDGRGLSRGNGRIARPVGAHAPEPRPPSHRPTCCWPMARSSIRRVPTWSLDRPAIRTHATLFPTALATRPSPSGLAAT